MITIELTQDEARFIFDNIAGLNIPMAHENAPTIAQLGNSVLVKLKGRLDGLSADKSAPRLASAARPKSEPADAPGQAETA